MSTNINMNKPEDKPESNVNAKLMVLGFVVAFAFGAFVRGAVADHQVKAEPEVCKATIQENGSNTVIWTQGSTEACTPFINALRGHIDDENSEDASDGEYGQAVPCDPASAPDGASQ